MFRKKSHTSKRGLHISEPRLSPPPPLPPRPSRPEYPWSGPDESQILPDEKPSEHEDEDEDEEHNSQTLLDLVHDYRSQDKQQEVRSGDHYEQEALLPEPYQPQQEVQEFHRFLQKLQQEAALATHHAQGAQLPNPLQSQQNKHELHLSERYPQQAASLASNTGQAARLPKPARPQNIQEKESYHPPTPTGSEHDHPSPNWPHVAPLSIHSRHETQLPKSFPPQLDIREESIYESTEENRFEKFARKTVAVIGRTTRKRGCDPADLITTEDMHRKQSARKVAGEVAVAEALRDDAEQNERRFRLAWEWLNANSRRNESMGEAVVALQPKRAREDEWRSGDRSTRLGDMMRANI